MFALARVTLVMALVAGAALADAGAPLVGTATPNPDGTGGGDITAVVAGTGLTSGGLSGDVTPAVDRPSCSNGTAK